MAKVFIPVLRNTSMLNSLTYYIGCVSGDASITTPEAEVQVKYNVAGTFSNSQLTVTANTLNGATTLRVRINGANGNGVVSVSSSTTGYFEDTSNTDTISANDLINFSIATAGSSGSVTTFACGIIFDASSNNFNRFAGGFNGFSTASVTRYYPLAGAGTVTSTEANTKLTVKNSFTSQNFYVYIASNARTTTTTLRTRKNGANGAMSVSVTTGATGVFEDNSNTDSLVSGDTYNLALTTGTGTGSIQPRTTSVALVNSNDQFLSMGSGGTARIVTAGSTLYAEAGADCLATSTTEAHVALRVRDITRMSNFTAYISFNNSNVTATAVTRIDGADGNQTFSVGAGATGTFTDSTNTDLLSVTSKINFKYSAPAGTGGTDFRLVSVHFSPATSIKTILGLAVASVKTVDGLAIASVKNYNGLA